MTIRNLNTASAISYGWASVKKDFWYFVGLSLIVVIVGAIGNNHHHPNQWNLIGFLLSILITCGYTKLFLSFHDGKKLPLSDLITQVKYYWCVLGASLLLGAMFVIGFALLIIPGIYVAVRFQFTIQLIIDKDLGIIEAMKESSRLTDGIKMSLLAFDLTLLGVILLGAICLGVGMLVAMPVVWLATVKVYRQLLGSSNPVAQKATK